MPNWLQIRARCLLFGGTSKPALNWTFSWQNSQRAVKLAYAEYTTFGQIASHVDLRYLLKVERYEGQTESCRWLDLGQQPDNSNVRTYKRDQQPALSEHLVGQWKLVLPVFCALRLGFAYAMCTVKPTAMESGCIPNNANSILEAHTVQDKPVHDQ